MKANIIREFEQQLNNPFQIRIRQFLADNTFEKVQILATWLKEQIKLKLEGAINFPEFEHALPSELRNVKSECDSFYFALFNRSEFINEHTVEKESSNPFTDAFSALYQRLFKENTTIKESLAIYSELRHQLENQLGLLLATDESLQCYEQWELLNKELGNDYEIYRYWIDNISTASIQKEKHKFALMPENIPFTNLAFLDGFGRNTEEKAKNYIAHCEKIKHYPAFQYVEAASKHADVWDLTSTVHLRQHLLYRTDIRDWLLFVDSLHYLNIQDHCFLSFTKIDDYVAAVKVITVPETFQTPKAHLLLCTLQNYYDFLKRTLTRLYECSGTAYKHHGVQNSEEIYTVIKKTYTDWIENYIPQTFHDIINAVFKDAELSKSEYFIVFFEWINSLTKSNLILPASDPVAELIDLLNKLFQEKLGSNNNDLNWLIERLSVEQINFETLKKFLFAYLDYPADHGLRDKLFAKYIEFINSDKFSWHAESNVRYSDAINNCYYLSNILCSYDDGLTKWCDLLTRNKTNHDGWNMTMPNYKIYQKESFIFCAGIGIAYYHYEKKQKSEGDIVLFTVLNHLMKQIRNGNSNHSIDYKTPLRFASLTIGSYSPEKSEDFISIIVQKCDSLHGLMWSLHELKEYNKLLSLSDYLKLQIKQRVNNEFEFLKKRNTVKYEIDALTNLKKVALEICS